MSKQKYTRIICDICDDDVADQRHYAITLKEYSTINCKYFKPKTIHICLSHEGSQIPYELLFNTN